jgi:hypothetical protein
MRWKKQERTWYKSDEAIKDERWSMWFASVLVALVGIWFIVTFVDGASVSEAPDNDVVHGGRE